MSSESTISLFSPIRPNLFLTFCSGLWEDCSGTYFFQFWMLSVFWFIWAIFQSPPPFLTTFLLIG
uniref:Candidate secreted effector n=1 Tax=Meloidogyne incognita TaxID=6306 RepID=A0A914LHT5_MELIC